MNQGISKKTKWSYCVGATGRDAAAGSADSSADRFRPATAGTGYRPLGLWMRPDRKSGQFLHELRKPALKGIRAGNCSADGTCRTDRRSAEPAGEHDGRICQCSSAAASSGTCSAAGSDYADRTFTRSGSSGRT